MRARGTHVLIGLLTLFVAAVWGIPTASAGGARVIETESGRLTGIVGAQVDAYLGIPYATPPVVNLRWRPPQPFGRWHGVFGATQAGPECYQPGVAPGANVSEDCLFLNVYTPHATKREDRDDGLAVMVWIHGGGLTTGAGSEFDPTPLVEGGGVIVVTFNYRLGLLGFFAHPALDHEGHLAGNYGFMDQQLALRWVRRNIAAFGGDPERVTIFGESAGGQSVYSQLASPLAARLFRGAIAQSGAYASFADYLDRILPIATAATVGQTAVPAGTTIAATIGCPSQTAACLRGLTPAEVLVGQPGTVYPFIDKILLTQTLRASYTSGEFNRVPVITGTNRDEYRFFVARDFDLKGHPLTDPSDYAPAVVNTFDPPVASFVLANYSLLPVPPTQTASITLAAAGTDGIFACTARHAMQDLAQWVTVYAYEFKDEHAPAAFPSPPLTFPMGAYHGADVQYLFNRNRIPAPFTPAQQQLSQAMIGYWTQFAKTGDPNSASEPFWAPYDPVTDLRQSFVPPTPTVESDFATDHRCAIWDSGAL
jgi:para-nitrobenzyl esterase